MLFILGSGTITKDVEGDVKFGKTEPFMKAIGRTIWRMVKVD